jgi:hypothetical protein
MVTMLPDHDASAEDGVMARGESGGLSMRTRSRREPGATGRLLFAKAIERDMETGSLRMARMIVVELEGLGPSVRGRLADVIDDAIEHELAARGAAGPGLTSSSDRDAALSDQLFRARRVGAPGVAIVLGPLRAAAGPLGALEPEDSATLRFLAAAVQERPVVLVLDERDASTGGYADPVPLGALLLGPPPYRPVAPAPTMPSAPMASVDFAEPAFEAELERAPDLASPPSPPEPAASSSELPPESGDLEPGSEPALASALAAALASDPAPAYAPAPESALAPAPALSPELVAAPATEFAPALPFVPTPMPQPPSLLARHTAGASIAEREESWRAWTLQLVAARGPQSLAALERLFTESYVPLANAVAAGLDDPRARSAQEEFRAAFTKSYTEAFPTFAATTKRPRMVLDVHDCASRIARLHGARSTRMLLVDAMRWDVARLVRERLVARLGERAALTDELVLWSALPTTTMRQLETIARGVEALRTPGEMDADAEPPRGRTAEYVRRLRVGPREVHKLDVVESRLQGARGGVLRAIPDIADAAADAIARHAETLAPNTLLFVFGDHGFTVDRAGAARQGGASPEEVLVGAFAFLVGDVH